MSAGSLVAVTAACKLVVADVSLAPSEDPAGGWTEETRLVVESAGGCRRVDLLLPREVHLGAHRARLHLSDDTRRRLDESRWELLPRGLDDEGIARLHVPELLKHDRVVVELVREWGPGAAFVWEPGADGATAGSIAVSGGELVTVDWDRSWEAVATGLPRAASLSLDAVPAHHELIAIPSPAPAEHVLNDLATHPWTPLDGGGKLGAEDAWRKAAAMAAIPRAIDGDRPIWGDEALTRGAADDRGFALTVASLAAGGPDDVRVHLRWAPEGTWLRARWVAVWWRQASPDAPREPVLLAHPAEPAAGPIWVPAEGAVEAVALGAEAPPLLEPEPLRVERTLEIHVPSGDPQTGLFPGGGSYVAATEELQFDPADAARAWLVPLPPDHGPVEVTVEPEDAGAIVSVREDAVAVLAPRSEERVVVRLRWTDPDAPACGEIRARPGEDLKWAVRAEEGRIRAMGDFWSLTSWDGKPVMPDRESVLKGLTYRFNTASMPEPALPMELRGHPIDDELITLFRPALQDRARVRELPGDPLWPRKLQRARRSEIVTPVEAALILRLYALQAHLPVTWALVRPADQGPGDLVCPAGHEEAVTIVEWKDELRWIDPGCTVCAPFELRPHLEGATAFSPSFLETRPPTPGRAVVGAVGDEVGVKLEGPAALLLRLWLEEVPEDARTEALARRIAGEGATLERAEGIDQAGEPIVLVARAAGGRAWDPLALPEARDDGSYWLDWVGERRFVHPWNGGDRVVARGTRETAHGPAEVAWLADARQPVDVDLGAVRYQRTIEEGRVVEVLEVRERRLDTDTAAKLRDARAGRIAGDVPEPQPVRAVLGAPATVGEALSAGEPVEVVALRGDVAVVRRGDATAEVPRADVQALPFRARLEGKGATRALRRNAAIKAPVVEKLPVAGDPVHVVSFEGDWAQVDVEGPLGSAVRTGWMERAALVPVTGGEPVVLGDLPLAHWAPVEQLPGGTVRKIVLERPLTLRGVSFPVGAVVAIGPQGTFDAVHVLQPTSVGGLDLAGGTTLAMPQDCDFAIEGQERRCLTVDETGQLVP